jgi:hypothetical protein
LVQELDVIEIVVNNTLGPVVPFCQGNHISIRQIFDITVGERSTMVQNISVHKNDHQMLMLLPN